MEMVNPRETVNTPEMVSMQEIVNTRLLNNGGHWVAGRVRGLLSLFRRRSVSG